MVNCARKQTFRLRPSGDSVPCYFRRLGHSWLPRDRVQGLYCLHWHDYVPTVKPQCFWANFYNAWGFLCQLSQRRERWHPFAEGKREDPFFVASASPKLDNGRQLGAIPSQIAEVRSSDFVCIETVSSSFLLFQGPPRPRKKTSHIRLPNYSKETLLASSSNLATVCRRKAQLRAAKEAFCPWITFV